METRFTQEFGVEHPITCGGMMGVGRAELISAVANAGALGFLSALTHPTPAELDLEIQRTRGMTDRPFGVNVTMLPSVRPIPYDEFIQVVADNKIPVVETAGRSPEEFMSTLKKANVKVIHKAVAVRHSVTAERLGVDALSVDGFECAGHPGEHDIPSLVLVPAVAAKVRTSIIASGGFATGRGLAAALALGADGINMGTRFLATTEAPVHENVKNQIVANTERDTTLVFRKFRNTARVAKNAVSEQIREIESHPGTEFAAIADLASGARGRERVLKHGEMEDGLWWAGLSQGLITEVQTCKEVIEATVAEAEEVIRTKLVTTIS